MKFSDIFKIRRTKKDTWFDPVLSIDTPLFIDPFLLYAQEKDIFRGSHKEIISYFNDIFKLIAQTKGNIKHPLYYKAKDLLFFPEREELCLGYTAGGTGGLGSGSELANAMAAAIWETIKAGKNEIKHFEEIGILRAGIGADRISDATAGMLINRFITYTSNISKAHNVPLNKYSYSRVIYNSKYRKWLPQKVNLPENPYNNKPILLVPEYYLDTLPIINAADFWNYCIDHKNATLRAEFNNDISTRVSKEAIIELAKKNPTFIDDYTNYREKRKPKPYDLKSDKKGLIKWYPATKQYTAEKPITLNIKSDNDFPQVINSFVDEYKHFIEENNGWKLLWNDNKSSKSEEAAQLLFLGIVKHYCAANDIDIARETNIGRGPVDFKIADGYKYRTLLELKLARNTRYWRGINKQLPTYLKAEKIKEGYFIVIIYTDNDADRMKGIRRNITICNKDNNYDIKVILIDARPNKLSASKL